MNIYARRKTTHVVLFTPLFNCLLGNDIPRTEEDSSGGALGNHGATLEQRTIV
jgi:hypothetical protein